MCQKIKSQDGRVFEVSAGSTIPKELIYRNGIQVKTDLNMSSHRFIRHEKIGTTSDGKIRTIGWKVPELMIPVQIKVSAFEEKGEWFDVPEGMAMHAYFHRGNIHNQYVISIATTESNDEIMRVHDRMPLFSEFQTMV